MAGDGAEGGLSSSLGHRDPRRRRATPASATGHPLAGVTRLPARCPGQQWPCRGLRAAVMALQPLPTRDMRWAPGPVCSPHPKSWLTQQHWRAGFGSRCASSSVPMVGMRGTAAPKVAARREGCVEHHCYQHPCKFFLKQCLKYINYSGVLESKLWERKRAKIA